jgi:hypothetical protein
MIVMAETERSQVKKTLGEEPEQGVMKPCTTEAIQKNFQN